jgi:transmembrane sensor
MSKTARDPAEVRRLAEASAWRVHLAEHDLEASDAFEEWLDADPRNVAAWDHVQAEWLHVGEQANAPELLKLRRDALDRARRQGQARWNWRGHRIALTASLVILCGSLAGGGYWWHIQPTIYETAIGERRIITLDDGSKASLDAGTELTVRFTDDTRKLELVHGQARFDVAHDPARPFLVQARDRTVIATGTAFNVDLLGPKIMVTLIEGRVVIVEKDSSAPPLQAFRTKPAKAVALAPGQQFVVAAEGPARVTAASLDRTSSWETGMLEFDNEPLGAVVERVERYSAEPIRVAPGASQMRISGVFKAGDVTTFVDVVTHYLPVSATKKDGTTVIAPKP